MAAKTRCSSSRQHNVVPPCNPPDLAEPSVFHPCHHLILVVAPTLARRWLLPADVLHRNDEYMWFQCIRLRTCTGQGVDVSPPASPQTILKRKSGAPVVASQVKYGNWDLVQPSSPILRSSTFPFLTNATAALIYHRHFQSIAFPPVRPREDRAPSASSTLSRSRRLPPSFPSQWSTLSPTVVLRTSPPLETLSAARKSKSPSMTPSRRPARR